MSLRTFKRIKNDKFWLQLAGLLSLQYWQESTQMLQVDGVVRTSSLISMSNYGENYSYNVTLVSQLQQNRPRTLSIIKSINCQKLSKT